MATPNDKKLNDLISAVINLNTSMEEQFILIGGASLIFQGSDRLTADVDLLLPSASIPRLAFTLTESKEVTRRAGVIYSKAGESEFSVDILKEVVDGKTFEDLDPFTIIVLDGIKTLDLPISLGIKIRCWFLHNEEVAGGRLKQESDIMDIAFISDVMQKSGRVVDDVVARAVRVGCYNMLLVKDRLEEMGRLSTFLAVGGDKFQVPWEEDTDDQREYYTMMMADEEEATGQQDDLEEASYRLS